MPELKRGIDDVQCVKSYLRVLDSVLWFCLKTHDLPYPCFNYSSKKTTGEGNGKPLQYLCLENPMDRGTRWAAARGIAKSRAQLNE